MQTFCLKVSPINPFYKVHVTYKPSVSVFCTRYEIGNQTNAQSDIERYHYLSSGKKHAEQNILQHSFLVFTVVYPVDGQIHVHNIGKDQ